MGLLLFAGITIAVWAATAGAHAAGQDYQDAWDSAKEAAELEWRHALQQAGLALKQAEENLAAAFGALGEHVTTGVPTDQLKETGHSVDGVDDPWAIGLGLPDSADPDSEANVEWTFEDYDEWYQHTYDEFQRLVEEEGLETSWEDYLREQQREDLGAYGAQRAHLEELVQIAEQQYELAREVALHLLESQQFIHDAAEVESFRQRRHEGAMAGASGMRSGAGHTAVQEYHAIRSAALERMMEEARFEYESRMDELALREQEMYARHEYALFELDQALADARRGFESGLDQMMLDLEQLREGLDFGLDQFSSAGMERAQWQAFFGIGSQAVSFMATLGATLGGVGGGDWF